MEDQEVHVNLDGWDYDIPKLPCVEYLLKNTIKRLEKTNDKIKFLAHHPTQYMRQLHLRLFTGDDFDDEEYSHLCVLVFKCVCFYVFALF